MIDIDVDNFLEDTQFEDICFINHMSQTEINTLKKIITHYGERIIDRCKEKMDTLYSEEYRSVFSDKSFKKLKKEI